jgi:hypothetical protein
MINSLVWRCSLHENEVDLPAFKNTITDHFKGKIFGQRFFYLSVILQ